MREITVDDHTFMIGNLDPKRAFHVVRHLAPLVGSLGEVLPYALGAKTFDPNDLDAMAQVIEPIAKGLSEMPESDVNYVIDTCLAVVQYRLPDGRGYTPIQMGEHLMYDWINMPLMVRLVFETVRENLSGFTFAGAPAS